jgi:hypothetical protein
LLVGSEAQTLKREVKTKSQNKTLKRIGKNIQSQKHGENYRHKNAASQNTRAMKYLRWKSRSISTNTRASTRTCMKPNNKQLT